MSLERCRVRHTRESSALLPAVSGCIPRLQLSQTLASIFVLLVLAGPAPAAPREVIRADWSRFQEQVSRRKLSGRIVRITLSGGGEIRTALVGIEDRGLLVRTTKAVKHWASGPDKARIPREQVSAVRFEGRTGRRGLIGGLVGLGVGVGVPVGISASAEYEEVQTGLAAIALGPILGTAGYLLGHARDKPAPEFIIE